MKFPPFLEIWEGRWKNAANKKGSFSFEDPVPQNKFGKALKIAYLALFLVPSSTSRNFHQKIGFREFGVWMGRLYQHQTSDTGILWQKTECH